MGAVSKAITIIRGVTSDAIEIVFTNKNGDQVNLDGWNVYAQVRKAPGKGIVMDLNPQILAVGELLGYDGEVDGPGRVKLGAYTDEETFAMSNAKLFWDIVLEDTEGQRTGPYVAGPFNIITIITEPT